MSCLAMCRQELESIVGGGGGWRHALGTWHRVGCEACLRGFGTRLVLHRKGVHVADMLAHHIPPE